jgi:hypothetical protein
VHAPAAEREGVAPSSEGGSTDEELTRFMQITLDSMARAQEGLRGVLVLIRNKRLVVKRDAVAAAASSAQRVPTGDHDPVSAPH